MSSAVASDTLTGLAGEFADLVDRLRRVDLVPASDDELVEFWRVIEIQQRRSAAVDHRVIAAVQARNLAGQRGYASTVALAREVLTVCPVEAKARVELEAAPRGVPDGQRLRERRLEPSCHRDLRRRGSSSNTS